MEQVGFEGTLQEFFEFTRTDPQFFYPDNEAGAQMYIDQATKHIDELTARLPEGLEASIGYDSTVYIRDAIGEVRATLLEAVAIVLVVIFLFLGSVRSSLIPAVTVPLSLIGAMFFMFVLGFSINLLTLLAMVLAIGMVVDDAIIVLENIHRHIEEGLSPMDAAITGARELVGPVIAMTLTLVSVYMPIGFLTGITGKLFTEFAFARPADGEVALARVPLCDTDRETVQGGLAMMRARNASEFADALGKWRFPSANVVFGDRRGDIGFQVVNTCINKIPAFRYTLLNLVIHKPIRFHNPLKRSQELHVKRIQITPLFFPTEPKFLLYRLP